MSGKEPNHKCAICGAMYYACNDCTNTKSFTPWRVITDTISHYKIYMIIRDYHNGVMTKEEAKEKLTACDLSEKNSFQPEIRDKINEILKSSFSKSGLKYAAPKKAIAKKADKIDE